MEARKARTPQYSAVTTAIVAQAAVFGLAALLRPYIGPPEPGPLNGLHADYLRRGASQRVQWRVLSDEPFQEAQRLDRPLIIVAGSAKSASARAFDFRILSGLEVAERLNREFVPVRIDLDQMPEWGPAIFPLSMAAANDDEAFWAACFDPAGTLLVFLSRPSPESKVEEREFLAFLTAARRARAMVPQAMSAAEARRRVERKLMTETVASTPQPEQADRINARIDPEAGGLTSPASRRLWPWDWRYLVRLGDARAIASGLLPATTGPLIDWTGPGCYRQTSDQAGRRPVFARDAVLDADCAALFADWAALTGEEWPRFLAKEFVRGIRESYVRTDGLFGHCFREVRDSSVGAARLASPRRLRESLSRRDRALLRQWTGVGLDSNLAAVPLAVNPQDVLRDPDAFREQVEKFDRIAEGVVERGSLGYLDATAWVGARMFEVGRLLDDEEARQLGLELSELALRLRAGPDDVVRTRDTGGGRSRTIVEYVAYAELEAEKYIATGDPTSLEDATAVFERAMGLFAEPRGRLAMVAGPVGQPFVPSLPSLLDGDRPSVVAMTVRTAWKLSCAWRGTERGAKLLGQALAVADAYQGLAAQVGFRTGAFELAELEARRDEFVAVAGPGSVSQARSLGPRLRGALVVPLTRTGARPMPQPGAWWIVQGAAADRAVPP
jgi:uncharacterized protein YyaL (SSP411 family)